MLLEFYSNKVCFLNINFEKFWEVNFCLTKILLKKICFRQNTCDQPFEQKFCWAVLLNKFAGPLFLSRFQSSREQAEQGFTFLKMGGNEIPILKSSRVRASKNYTHTPLARTNLNWSSNSIGVGREHLKNMQRYRLYCVVWRTKLSTNCGVLNLTILHFKCKEDFQNYLLIFWTCKTETRKYASWITLFNQQHYSKHYSPFPALW